MRDIELASANWATTLSATASTAAAWHVPYCAALMMIQVGGKAVLLGQSVTAASCTGSGNGTSWHNLEWAPQACRYDNCVAPNYRDNAVLLCSSGAWLVATERCWAPDECPPYVTLGDACGWEGSQGSLGPCSGSNACGAFEAYCTDGSWQLRADEAAPDGNGGEGGADGTAPSTSVTTSPAPMPQCPTYPPLQGTSCCPGDVPAYCAYSGSSSDSVTATQSASSAVAGPAGTVGGFLSLSCAECSPTMVWTASDACP